MPEAKFVLKEPEGDKETLIYLFYNFNYKRFKFSTGEKILPKYWNFKDQRVKETKSFPEYPEFNSRLKNIETAINNVYRRLLNDGVVPTTDKLRDELNIELDKEKRKDKLSLFEFIQLFIDESAAVKKEGTVKNYVTAFNNLKGYAVKKRKKLDFEDINLDFYNDLIAYLINDLKFSNNTVGNFIKILKVFLNEATERDINTNLDFKKKKFKRISEATDKIYLTKEEIKKLYLHDLSERKSLERVRDLFVIGCYTGLRYSDYDQIKQENIFEENKLKVKTLKTNESVVIPLHPVVKEILTKYNEELPKSISNQKMNDYLKEIGELAELNDTIELNVTKGGKRQTTYHKKHELISTHAARRSFATNLYLAGIPSIHIMKITGHKSEKIFMQYIRITQEENANSLLNHAFFQ